MTSSWTFFPAPRTNRKETSLQSQANNRRSVFTAWSQSEGDTTLDFDQNLDKKSKRIKDILRYFKTWWFPDVQEVHEQHPALLHWRRCKRPRLHIAQVTFSQISNYFWPTFFSCKSASSICSPWTKYFHPTHSPPRLLLSVHWAASFSTAHWASDFLHLGSKKKVLSPVHRVSPRVCPEPHISPFMRSKNSFGPRLHGTSC